RSSDRQIMWATLDVLAQVAATVLVPALTELSGWMQDNQGVVTVLVGAYVGWRTVLIAASAAAKVKAGWLAIMSVRTKAVAAATRVARAATVAWNASVVAGRWTAQIGQLAVMRTRTLAVAAAQRTARAATIAWNAAVAAGRWTAMVAQLVAYRAASLATVAAT